MFRVIQKAAFFTEDNLRAIALVGGKYPNMFSVSIVMLPWLNRNVQGIVSVISEV